MSPDGVPAAIAFIGLFAAFTAAVLGFDVWLRTRYGDNGTISYGVRYLMRHVPLVTHLAMFLFGMLVGGLLMHFAGSPLFWD